MSARAVNLVGQKFGRWKVLSRAENSKDGGAKWLCLCECGEERTVSSQSLRNSSSCSCGCLQRENLAIDLTGQKFGRLTVVSSAGRGKGGIRWSCLCECGAVTTALCSELRRSNIRSCGCLKIDLARGRNKGGVRNKGSEAWANAKLVTMWWNSLRGGYHTPVGAAKDVQDLWEQSNGKCEICGVPRAECSYELCLDHDHTTGELRGFICRHCNYGLGNFKDSPEILREAADYLELAQLIHQERDPNEQV